MENRDLQGSWGGATVRQDYAMMMMMMMIVKKNYDDIFSRFDTIPACHGQTDGRTDRQTELLYQYRASVC